MNKPIPEDVEATVTFLPTAHGGKSLSVSTGYRPQFYYNGHDWDARHIYPDVDRVNPGDTVRVILGFMSPDEHLGKLKVGSPFLIREGQRILGYGAITRILNLEASAEHARALKSSQTNTPAGSS